MTRDTFPSYMRYWGKARMSEHQFGADYHLLPYHNLDVAACGFHLVIANRFHAADILAGLGFSLHAGATWFAYFLAWHDLGKFARGFQQLYTHGYAQLVPPVPGINYPQRHDTLGYWLWTEHLLPRWQEEGIALLPDNDYKKRYIKSLTVWLQTVTGHHGIPPDPSAGCSLAFTPEDCHAAESYLLDLREVFLLDSFPISFFNKNWIMELKQQSWLLAGLSVLADWLGSNQVYFPYMAEQMPLSEYWEHAQQQAMTAVDTLPSPSMTSAYSGYLPLFPTIRQLTPLQQLACEVDISQPGPQLLILEDVTGSGKTEAALILAHRLMAQAKADGLYVGLPTMATANAMFERLANAYRGLFTPESRPSLILAHGASAMSTAFNHSVWQENNEGQDRYATAELSASSECNGWFADSRKKSLLAEVGVGTLDQALMAAMPYRHQSLRLLGLYHKVLILDEVHAYDGYMVRLLEGLLHFHAAQGGSAIILSATLPYSLRSRLLHAFEKGAGWTPQPLNPDAGYPWLSHLSDNCLSETKLDTRTEVKRRVKITWLTQPDEAFTIIEQAARQGQCICWIRNSVDDAITIYRQLHDRGNIPQENLLLFHSRFAFIDRMGIEQKALRWFGKDANPQWRYGKVLIATQVVEQSLDIDVDQMISDLAPIDLLIQRAGRLQRHIRRLDGSCKDTLPDDRPLPELKVLAPEWQPDAKKGWLGEWLKNTGYVYANHAVLWRTQAILRDLGSIAMPEQARTLVESVYEETIEAPIDLQNIADKVFGELLSKRAAAEQSILMRDKGYSRLSSDVPWGREDELSTQPAETAFDPWASDVQISTRLSDPSIDVYLAYRDAAGAISPYAAVGDFPWEKSRLQIRESWWRKHAKSLPQLSATELEKFQQQHHRVKAVVLLLINGENSGYYSNSQGLVG